MFTLPIVLPFKRSAVQKFITDPGLKMIEKAIAIAESTTDGEICVHIVGDSKMCDGDTPQDRVRNRALGEFEQLNIQQTENATGILILVSVEEKRVEIVADKGINDKIKDFRWEQEANKVVEAAKLGAPAVGIIDAIMGVGRHLTKHFPKTEGNTNELSNTVTTG